MQGDPIQLDRTAWVKADLGEKSDEYVELDKKY